MTNNLVLPSILKSPVSVVCHDAGAANLVFAWLRKWAETGLLDEHEFNVFLQGPAQKTWQNNPVPLPKMKLHNELTNAVAGCKSALTGTGWASSLEHDARKIAASLQIPSIAVIDHWVNYAQRFEHEGVKALPNQIWVSDHYAVEIACKLFKDVPVVELPNLYLQNLVEEIKPIPKDCKNLLYVLEPIRNEWGKGIPGEFQCLDFFAENYWKILGENSLSILLRPHPSDPPYKYDAWIKANSQLDLQLDLNANLSESISNARWVVGAETYAMVVAIFSRRDTYSILPPWAPKCRIPYIEIKHFREKS